MTHSIISSNNPYEKQFNLSWTPNSSDLRDNPYIITTRFFNGTFSMDYTFLIYVIRNNTRDLKNYIQELLVKHVSNSRD